MATERSHEGADVQFSSSPSHNSDRIMKCERDGPLPELETSELRLCTICGTARAAQGGESLRHDLGRSEFHDNAFVLPQPIPSREYRSLVHSDGWFARGCSSAALARGRDQGLQPPAQASSPPIPASIAGETHRRAIFRTSRPG